jgi:hypothetical protein
MPLAGWAAQAPLDVWRASGSSGKFIGKRQRFFFFFFSLLVGEGSLYLHEEKCLSFGIFYLVRIFFLARVLARRWIWLLILRTGIVSKGEKVGGFWWGWKGG